MPSDTDAASEPVAEGDLMISSCTRTAVNVEQLVKMALREGHDVALYRDDGVRIFNKKWRERRPSKPTKRPSDADDWRRAPATGAKTSKQRRDEERNTRANYEERMLKKHEKAEAERQASTAANTEQPQEQHEEVQQQEQMQKHTEQQQPQPQPQQPEAEAAMEAEKFDVARPAEAIDQEPSEQPEAEEQEQEEEQVEQAEQQQVQQ